MNDRPKPMAHHSRLSVQDARKTKAVDSKASKDTQIRQAIRLKEKGMSNVAIAKTMKISESAVRNLLKPSADTQNLVKEIKDLTQVLDTERADRRIKEGKSLKGTTVLIDVNSMYPQAIQTFPVYFRNPKTARVHKAKDAETFEKFTAFGWIKTDEKPVFEKDEHLMHNPFRESSALQKILINAEHARAPKVTKGKTPVKRSPQPARRNSTSKN